MILIIDFGSQSTHLISRRLKELGVASTIVDAHKVETSSLHFPEYKGIILSGGPSSVYEKMAPTVDESIYHSSVPILGICYGMQLMSHQLGGQVKPGKIKEYGAATLSINSKLINLNTKKNVIPSERSDEESSASADSHMRERSLHFGRDDKVNPLFAGIAPEFQAWMSHGDEVVGIPKEFEVIGSTSTVPYAAIQDARRKIYGIQFHPEVVHTQNGLQILENFCAICGVSTKREGITKEHVEGMVEAIRVSIPKGKAICAFSGGIDSTVAALLVHQAIGSRLTAIYIDSGLMRDGETAELSALFAKHYDMKVKIVHAAQDFLRALKGIEDPEKKRLAIGKTFIKVLDREAKRIGADYLVQGTIYPDVVESAGDSKHAHKIKSHHNVGGLPANLKLTLVEPLRTLYKDEVRAIGNILELPEVIVKRQPFPGPGLAIRIIGEVTHVKLRILRAADKIVREEIQKAGLTEKIWQAFAVYAGIKTTGVRGDARFYGHTIAIRAIEATDAMSAEFARLDWEVLHKMSQRIVTEVNEINRVVYDVTSKPPGTMEWE